MKKILLIMVTLALFAGVTYSQNGKAWDGANESSNFCVSNTVTMTLTDSLNAMTSDWESEAIVIAAKSGGSLTWYFTGNATDSIKITVQHTMKGNANLIDTCFITAQIKGGSSATVSSILFTPSSYGDQYRIKVAPVAGHLHSKATILTVGFTAVPLKKRYDDKWQF
jgi:hypothetical protein